VDTSSKPSFYDVGDATGFSEKYPFAYSDARRVLHHACGLCGGWDEPMDRIVLTFNTNQGVRWPDCLGVCSDSMGLYVSERVLRDWDEAGIRRGPVIPATFSPPIPRRFRGVPPPTYYHLKGHKGVELDYAAMGCSVDSCPSCGLIQRMNPSLPDRVVFVEGSWNGSDVFKDSDTSRSSEFGSDRLLRLTQERGHTNFCFTPIERFGDPLAIGSANMTRRKV